MGADRSHLIEPLVNLLNLAQIARGVVREQGVREADRAQQDQRAQSSAQAGNFNRPIAGTPLVSSL